MVNLLREDAANGPIITHIGRSGFRTLTAQFAGGILLTPLEAQDWVPPLLQDLCAADIAGIITLDPVPEFVLLGTGVALVHPSVALRTALESADIGLEVMDSAAAARSWSMLRAEGRWIAAALYPLG
jgi:uncharacterized protein